MTLLRMPAGRREEARQRASGSHLLKKLAPGRLRGQRHQEVRDDEQDEHQDVGVASLDLSGQLSPYSTARPIPTLRLLFWDTRVGDGSQRNDSPARRTVVQVPLSARTASVPLGGRQARVRPVAFGPCAADWVAAMWIPLTVIAMP